MLPNEYMGFLDNLVEFVLIHVKAMNASCGDFNLAAKIKLQWDNPLRACDEIAPFSGVPSKREMCRYLVFRTNGLKNPTSMSYPVHTSSAS